MNRIQLIALAALVAGLGLVTRKLPAQVPDSTTRCDGVAVQHVDVETNRPSFLGAGGWWRRIARSLGLHHQTTAAGLVRRFVSLDPGQHCTEFRRSESERILRAQPFLSDASVTTSHIRDSIWVSVSTVDEVPVVAGVRLRGAKIQAFNLGTMNLLGAGLHVEGRWEDGRHLRDGFGGKITHRQVLGRPYAIFAEGQRRPLGENFSGGLHHPFYTDLQRVAWYAGYTMSKDLAQLRKPNRTVLLQPIDRAIWNVGGVFRVGPPRRLGLLGAMLLGERIVPRDEFSMVDPLTGRVIPALATDTAGVRHHSPYDVTSVAGVFGVRSLSYSRMRGIDALEAEQDVATGAQIGTMLGMRPWARVPLRESFASVDAYVGARSRRTFAGARIEAESRLDFERQDWKHFIASGRGAWYFKPSPRWVSELSIEAAAGWRTMLPFQLDLGDRRGGVRGYARSLEAGGQRVLGRFEQRVDLARFKGTRAAIGAAAFADAGRIWSGDVAFGVNTPIRTSLGAAVLAAIPARSQRTIRAEMAVPLSRGQGARPELRFSVREPARGFWFEPDRIRWARLSAVPEQIFNWP